MTEDEFTVEVGDDTLPFTEQARLNGWKAALFDFGKAEQPGLEYFNPGLVRRPDGLWLLVRRSEVVEGMPYGMNRIWACKLKDDLTPVGGPLLAFPGSEPQEQFEDPRVVRWNDQTWVSAINFTWFPDGSWTGAHICLGYFRDDEEWTPVARRDPPVGTNLDRAGHTGGRHNKNLLWFFHDSKLHLIYTSDPWRVVEFGNNWDEQIHHTGEGVRWKFGHVRGGTPPVLVDDLYWTFFHSSLPWRDRFRRYYMGAIAFEAKPPFKPVLWTQEPILAGSQNDPWAQRKPLVVFPCGALLENNQWLITLGINDLKSGWVRIPHEAIVERCKPIPPAPAAQLLGMATPKPTLEHIPFNEGEKYEAALDRKTETVDVPDNRSPARDNVAVQGTPRDLPSVRQDIHADNGEREDAQLQLRRAQAAKARAVLAEKRANGTLKAPKRRKRRRRGKVVRKPIESKNTSSTVENA